MWNGRDKSYKILPTNNYLDKSNRSYTAKPVHVRRIEKAVNPVMFLQNLQQQLLVSSDSEDSEDDIDNLSDINLDTILKDSEHNSTNEYYNLKSVSTRRKWLADVLQESSDNGPEDVQYKHVLRLHSYQKSLRKTKENFDNYAYYGAGLILPVDYYPHVEKNLPAPVKKHKVKVEDTFKSPLYHPDILDAISDEPCLDLNIQNGMDFQSIDDMTDKYLPSEYGLVIPNQSLPPPPLGLLIPKKKAKRFKDEESRRKWEDMMTIKRRKLYTNIVKKEIGKQHRAKINKHKELLLQCKRVASQCAKSTRQRALQSARIVKEQPWRMKRLSRENIAYWKRSRRIDREVKKRLEKEAEEQRKIDHELGEAKRQQRKLNFLITQTELYAHFMGKKLEQASPEEQLRILSQLDEESSTKLSCDTYDSQGKRPYPQEIEHFSAEKDAPTNSQSMENEVSAAKKLKSI